MKIDGENQEYFSSFTIIPKIITLKEKFLQVFFCYFDEYEFYFVFFVPSKKQNYDFIKTIAFKNSIEFYTEKIKEIFNELVKNHMFTKLSKIFEMNLNQKNILKLNSLRFPESSKFCYLQVENMMELPADTVLKRKYFFVLFENILQILHENSSENSEVNLNFEGKYENNLDLSYLCSIIPDNKPKIFIEKEPKKNKNVVTNKRNRQIYKEISVSASTVLELEFSENNNNFCLIFSEKVKK